MDSDDLPFGDAAARAAIELERVALAIEALPERWRRKILRRPEFVLDPDIIRNEAERARDVLHVYGYYSAQRKMLG